jgi:hypothetical protein
MVETDAEQVMALQMTLQLSTLLSLMAIVAPASTIRQTHASLPLQHLPSFTFLLAHT